MMKKIKKQTNPAIKVSATKAKTSATGKTLVAHSASGKKAYSRSARPNPNRLQCNIIL